MYFPNNLAFIRKKLNVNQKELANKIGVKAGTISNYEKGVSQPDLNKLSQICLVLDVGIDDMLNSDLSSYSNQEKPSSLVSGSHESYTVVGREKHVDGRKGIPLVGVEALGGSGSEFMVINDSDILERYHVPEFKDVDFLIPLKGESMAPAYLGGDIIACRTITNRTFLIWGRAYLIASRSHGIIVKRLFPGSNVDSLTCRSDNPDYPDFEIPQQNEIDGLALVVGLIRTD